VSGARELLPGALAVLGNNLAAAVFVEMRLATPIYMCNAAIDIEAEGKTWIGVEQMQVQEVSESSGQVDQMQFTLPAVPNDYLSLALSTTIRSKTVVLYLGIFSPDTQEVLQLLRLWSGQLDQMPVKFGPETASITVTAEHRAVAYARPKPSRYTDAEQRRLHAGDKCLQYLISQSQAQDIWPSADWFKQ
jgi:hypothetical protein